MVGVVLKKFIRRELKKRMKGVLDTTAEIPRDFLLYDYKKYLIKLTSDKGKT